MQSLRKALLTRSRFSTEPKEKVAGSTDTKNFTIVARNHADSVSTSLHHRVQAHQNFDSDLEFSSLMQQQQTCFVDEMKGQWTENNERLMEFNSFMNHLDSQIVEVEKRWQQRFDYITKEQDQKHLATFNVNEALFLDAEKQRKDCFRESQATYEQQAVALGQQWEHEFTEGRKARDQALRDAEVKIDERTKFALECQEEKFLEEERQRYQDVEDIVEECLTQSRSSSGSSSPSACHWQVETVDLPTATCPHNEESGSKQIPRGSSTDSKCQGVRLQKASNASNADDRRSTQECICKQGVYVPLQSETPFDDDEAMPVWRLGAGVTLSKKPLRNVIPSSPSPSLSDKNYITASERNVASSNAQEEPIGAPVLEDEKEIQADSLTADLPQAKAATQLEEVEAVHQRSSEQNYRQMFDDIQAERLKDFENAEAKRFASTSEFHGKYESSVSDHGTGLDSVFSSYSRVIADSEQVRYYREEDRHTRMETNERRRQRISDAFMERVQADFELANKVEALWDDSRKAHVRTVLKQSRALSDSKMREVMDRYGEAHAMREERLRPVLPHDDNNNEPPENNTYEVLNRPFGSAMMARVNASSAVGPVGSRINSWDSEKFLGFGKARSLVSSASSRSPIDSEEVLSHDGPPLTPPPAVGFVPQTLFVNMSSMISTSLPIPRVTPRRASSSPTTSNHITLLGQMKTAFEASMKDMRSKFDLNEKKRREDFVAAQNDRVQIFQEFLSEKERQFRRLALKWQERFTSEELTRQCHFHSVQLTWEKAFCVSQKLRTDAWEALRMNMVRMLFELEAKRMIELDNWIQSSIKNFQAIEEKEWHVRAMKRNAVFVSLRNRVIRPYYGPFQFAS